jgi:hypothetical protein
MISGKMQSLSLAAARKGLGAGELIAENKKARNEYVGAILLSSTYSSSF